MPVGICQLVLYGFFDLFLLPSRKGAALVCSVRWEGSWPFRAVLLLRKISRADMESAPTLYA